MHEYGWVYLGCGFVITFSRIYWNNQNTQICTYISEICSRFGETLEHVDKFALRQTGNSAHHIAAREI